MAAWRRRGGIEPFREKLVKGMLERGYTLAFAEQIYQQIQGFGEYGFPESHAASFALLVYVSCWLKRHEPAAFACALLNSQPLGFYSPSQIVQDARRHGVEVRPVDVLASEVDSTLEPGPGGEPAIRLGLGMVNGLKVNSAESIVIARKEKIFESVDDLARRAGLDKSDLSRLARADALATLAGHRREALWSTLAVDEATRLALPAGVEEARAGLAPPTEGQEVVGDYAALGLTLRRHPLAILRSRLKTQGLRTAEEVAAARHGQWIRTSGHRHLPAAPGHGERGALRDPGGRDRLREPGGLERHRGAQPPADPGLAAAGGGRAGAEAGARGSRAGEAVRGPVRGCWGSCERPATTSTDTLNKLFNLLFIRLFLL